MAGRSGRGEGAVVTFEEVVDQAMAMLQRRGRVAYRLLKRQFNLDDASLEDLRDALLYAHPVVDDGRGLIWTGAPAASEPDAPRAAEVESRFHALLPEVRALLQRNRRVTYHRLTSIFRLDQRLLEAVRRKLVFTQVVGDEQGEGLVWTGEAPPMLPPAVAVPHQPATAETMQGPSPALPPRPLPIAETDTRANGPTASPGGMDPDVPHDEAAGTPEPIRHAPEAERRQVTVLFCDLVDSTRLSQQLDAEDYRAVVRAYQQAAVTALQPWDGYVAQYLGDGLLVYFGWPTAHEDAAVRAVHASLALLAALEPFNTTQLAPRYGVRVQVRLGVHTGLAVIGAMGGGDRHEQLAMGETPNIAARLQGLAAPDTVVLSAVTARLVQRRFALEPLGTHPLKGVTETMPVFQVLG